MTQRRMIDPSYASASEEDRPPVADDQDVEEILEVDIEEPPGDIH